MIALFLALSAAAAPRDVRVGLGGMAEAWSDASISGVYKSGSLSGGGLIAVDILGPLSAVARFSYKRLTPETGAAPVFEVLPVTLAVEGHTALGEGLQGFADLGYSHVTWTERGAQTSLRGARPMGELDIGLRWDLGLSQPAMAPAAGRTTPVVELEVLLGRRQGFGKEGFDLSAWRGGAAAVARF